VISAEQYQGLIAERKIGLSLSEVLENMRRPAKEQNAPKSSRPRFLFNMLPGKGKKSTKSIQIHVLRA
jgi:hypothetical protein